MTLSRFALVFALLLGFAGGAAAGEAMKGDIHVDQPWARASIGAAKAGAAYMTLANHGSEADRLLAVETDVARRSELHTHLMEDGVMKMRQVEAIEVDPGTPTVLEPGGLHVMLMGLEAPLEQGKSFPLRLIFERAGAIEVTVEIGAPAAMKPEGEMQHDHGHDHQTHDSSS